MLKVHNCKFGTGCVDSFQYTVAIQDLINKCDKYISGIKDKDGKYVIPIPRWSRTVYAAGTKVHYYHEENIDINTVYIPGPTTEKLTIVVRDVFRC